MKLSRWITLFIVVLLLAVTVATGCSSKKANQPPTITSLVAVPTSVTPGASSVVTCIAADPEGDSLSYTWTFTGGAQSGTGDTITWVAPSAANTYTVRVSVNDGKGGVANSSVAIVVAVVAPTPTPAPTEGSIDIKSGSIDGAKVIIDGIDTSSVTPYVATHVAVGNHTVKLEYAHYKWRSGNVSVVGGETAYVNWALTYADVQTLTIQPNASEGKDSCVYSYLPDKDRSTEVNVYAGGDSSARYSRIYIQFSVSAIPSTAVIENAALRLNYSYSYSKDVQAPIGVYRVTSTWNESTVTWNNQPTFNTTVIDTVLVPTVGTFTFMSWDVTSLVKSWSLSHYVRNVNCGMVLMDTDESTDEGWKAFQSSDATDASARPKLVITYYDPTT